MAQDNVFSHLMPGAAPSAQPQGNVFTLPPSLQQQRQNDRQDRNDNRTASNEAERIRLERARLLSELQAKGLTMDGAGNIVPLQSSAPPSIRAFRATPTSR